MIHGTSVGQKLFDLVTKLAKKEKLTFHEGDKPSRDDKDRPVIVKRDGVVQGFIMPITDQSSRELADNDTRLGKPPKQARSPAPVSKEKNDQEKGHAEAEARNQAKIQTDGRGQGQDRYAETRRHYSQTGAGTGTAAEA